MTGARHASTLISKCQSSRSQGYQSAAGRYDCLVFFSLCVCYRFCQTTVELVFHWHKTSTVHATTFHAPPVAWTGLHPTPKLLPVHITSFLAIKCFRLWRHRRPFPLDLPRIQPTLPTMLCRSQFNRKNDDLLHLPCKASVWCLSVRPSVCLSVCHVSFCR